MASQQFYREDNAGAAAGQITGEAQVNNLYIINLLVKTS